MDDFNMNNKTPLNSSDQNNEQPAAATQNTAPQNEHAVPDAGAASGVPSGAAADRLRRGSADEPEAAHPEE